MQLNNRITGHKILSNKIDINQKRIVYSEYEQIVFDSDGNEVVKFLKEQKSKVFNDIDLSILADNTLSIEDNILKIYLTALLNTLKDKENWEISENKQNWLYQDRNYCITILNSFILKELQPINAEGDLSPIGTIINNERTNNYGFYSTNDGDKVMTLYTPTISPDDQPIIQPFLGTKIWLETKLT